MALEHLKFFNKRGFNVTPDIDNDGIFRIDLHFDDVSVNLFETETLYIYEEILKNVGRTVEEFNKTPIFKPLEIKILEFLDNKPKVKETDIYNFFDNQVLGQQYVEEFLNYRTNLIERFWESEQWWLSLKLDGKKYLDDYNKNILNLKNKEFGFIPELVKPRSNFEKEQDEAFLFFKWKKNEFDDNIFTFEINNNDKTQYYRGFKAVCLDTPKKYPQLIRFKNSDLLLSKEYNNGTIRDIFINNYSFDNGIDDNLEDPINEYYYDENNELIRVELSKQLSHKQRRILSLEQKINHDPIKINFAINSSYEGYFNRTLELFFIHKTYYDTDVFYENVYKIAEINLYGNVIGEDERFTKLLENFGRKIDKKDFYIFKESDIDEDFEDYIFINNKYKELLLVGEEIYPYLGSYKAFRNALKWLGYQDLKIKEYFYNIEFSDIEKGLTVYSSVEIPKETQVPEYLKEEIDWQTWVYGSLLENPNFIKTSRLGLSYSINKFTGEWDEYGYPIMEDNYEYSSEEFLIKLYGLKNVLEKYFLPHHAKIIDITAEGIYFVKYKILTWNDFDITLNLFNDNSVDFKATPLNSYLFNLKKLIYVYKYLFNQLDEFNVTKKINDFKNINLIFLKNKKIELNNNNNTNSYKCWFGYGEPFLHLAFDYNYYLDLNNGYFYELDFDYYNKTENGIFHWKFKEDLRKLTTEIFNDENITTIDKIIYSYPTLEKLENALYEQIFFNLNDYNPKQGYNDAENKNILGVAINLELLPRNILVEDLKLSFDDIDYIDGYPGGKLYSFWGINNYQGQIIRWTIYYSDNPKEFKYIVEGNIDNYSEHVVFLPKIGNYDVICEVVDITNRRILKTKRQYIEVKNRNYDFYVIGKNPIKKYSTIDEIKYFNFYEIVGTLNNIIENKNITDFLNLNIKFAKLNYSFYKNQNFLKDYLKYDLISNIDRKNNIIELQTNKFYIDYTNNNKNYYNQTITFEKDYYENIFHKVESFNENKILKINKVLNIKKQSEILVCNILSLNNSDFYIKDNTVTIKSKYYDYFNQGDFINLYYKDKYYIYKIININFDIINNIIELEVENDGSLNYINDSVTSTSFNKFEKLEIIKNASLCFIDDFYIKDGYTYIVLNSGIFTKDFDNLYIQLEPSIGEQTYIIKNVKLNDKNHTEVELEGDLCNLSSFYKAKWTPEFEYLTAKLYSSVDFNENYYKNVKISDIGNYSFNDYSFSDFPTMGFTIKKYYYNSGLAIDDQILMFDLANIEPVYRNNELLKQLNNSKLSNFKKFNFYLIDGYIKAVKKISFKNDILNINGLNGTVVNNNDLPHLYFNRWNQIFFNGYNTIPSWNYAYDFLTNKENTKIDSFINIKSFITKKDVIVNNGSILFFTNEECDDFDNNTEFEWEIWFENKNKLLTKSKKNYLIWKFVERGYYTVIMNVKINSKVYKIEKKNFIKIQ